MNTLRKLGVQHIVEQSHRQAGGIFGIDDPGIIDQNIRLAERLGDSRNDRLELIGIADIQRKGFRGSATGSDFGDKFVELVFSPGGTGNLGPACPEDASKSAA